MKTDISIEFVILTFIASKFVNLQVKPVVIEDKTKRRHALEVDNVWSGPFFVKLDERPREGWKEVELARLIVAPREPVRLERPRPQQE